MKSYPITMARRSYRGSNARERQKVNEYNRVATKIEQYLNADLEAQQENCIQVYMSYLIASNIGESSDLVHDIVFATDCGSNGITIVKGDYDRAIAPTPAEKLPETSAQRQHEQS